MWCVVCAVWVMLLFSVLRVGCVLHGVRWVALGELCVVCGVCAV